MLAHRRYKTAGSPQTATELHHEILLNNQEMFDCQDTTFKPKKKQKVTKRSSSPLPENRALGTKGKSFIFISAIYVYNIFVHQNIF